MGYVRGTLRYGYIGHSRPESSFVGNFAFTIWSGQIYYCAPILLHWIPISHVTKSVTTRIRLDMVRLLVTTNLCPTTRFNHLGFSAIICRCANGLPFWITFARNFRGFVACGVFQGNHPSMTEFVGFSCILYTEYTWQPQKCFLTYKYVTCVLVAGTSS